MTTEFNLSGKQLILITKITEMVSRNKINYSLLGDLLGKILLNEKEFIRRQIERIDNRISVLSEFDGLGEIMLQKAELNKVKRDMLEDAGEKLA